MAKRNIFWPTEAEMVRLIQDTHKNGLALDFTFGPSGAWIEWNEGEPEPWAVTRVKEYRGLPLVGTDGEGI